jgi:FAD/FMN-containing dehydrogenase
MWKNHYGPQWPEVERLKARYDPESIFNPRVVSRK